MPAGRRVEGAASGEFVNAEDRARVSVITGQEAKRTIDCISSPDYRVNLNKELDEVNNMEIWRVGKEIRKLRTD